MRLCCDFFPTSIFLSRYLVKCSVLPKKYENETKLEACFTKYIILVFRNFAFLCCLKTLASAGDNFLFGKANQTFYYKTTPLSKVITRDKEFVIRKIKPNSLLLKTVFEIWLYISSKAAPVHTNIRMIMK